MKIIDISKCDEDVINYINKLVNNYFGLEKLYNEKDKEIERLTELCNKYEEEHNTTFETWKKDIKENELLHSIIKEVREYAGDLRTYDGDSIEFEISNDIFRILDKENI